MPTEIVVYKPRAIPPGILLCMFATCFALSMWAQDGSKDRVKGTAHDLNSALHSSHFSSSTCAICHIPRTPEKSVSTASDSLAWDCEIPSAARYRAYASPSRKAALRPLQGVQLTSEEFFSTACLSCHDGSAAITGVYRMPDNGTFKASLTNGSILDGPIRSVGLNEDLSHSHPVNFAYDAALVRADRGLWDSAGWVEPIEVSDQWQATAVRASLSYDAYSALQQPVLFNGTVQCATCHNPHSETNPHFLRVPLNKLCVKCHSTSARYND